MQTTVDQETTKLKKKRRKENTYTEEEKEEKKVKKNKKEKHNDPTEGDSCSRREAGRMTQTDTQTNKQSF